MSDQLAVSKDLDLSLAGHSALAEAPSHGGPLAAAVYLAMAEGHSREMLLTFAKPTNSNRTAMAGHAA